MSNLPLQKQKTQLMNKCFLLTLLVTKMIRKYAGEYAY